MGFWVVVGTATEIPLGSEAEEDDVFSPPNRPDDRWAVAPGL